MSAPEVERRPWHEGENAARRRAGAQEIAPVIRRFMNPQSQAFFSALPMVFVAGLDGAGRPAASILRGAPGFIRCPDAQRMDIAAALPDCDPLLDFFGRARLLD